MNQRQRNQRRQRRQARVRQNYLDAIVDDILKGVPDDPAHALNAWVEGVTEDDEAARRYVRNEVIRRATSMASMMRGTRPHQIARLTKLVEIARASLR